MNNAARHLQRGSGKDFRGIPSPCDVLGLHPLSTATLNTTLISTSRVKHQDYINT